MTYEQMTKLWQSAYALSMGIGAFTLLDVREYLLAAAGFIHFFNGLHLLRPGWFTRLVRSMAGE